MEGSLADLDVFRDTVLCQPVLDDGLMLLAPAIVEFVLAHSFPSTYEQCQTKKRSVILSDIDMASQIWVLYLRQWIKNFENHRYQKHIDLLIVP